MDREQHLPRSEEGSSASVELPVPEAHSSIRSRRKRITIIVSVLIAAILIFSWFKRQAMIARIREKSPNQNPQVEPGCRGKNFGDSSAIEQ